MRIGTTAILISTMLAVAGCTVVSSSVSRFDNFSRPIEGATFLVLPLESQKGSAEFNHYAQRVALRLEQKGFRRVNELSDAEYVLTMNYGISGSRTITGTTPIYGQTGGGTTTHSGTVSTFGTGGSTFGSYRGTSYTPPTFGVVGAVPYTRREHDRYFVLRLVDLKGSTQENIIAAYEATVSSAGRAQTFADVSECLFDAVFKNFRNTGTETVRLPPEDCGNNLPE